MDVPIHIGFSILQYAKLRMLEFYYDFMDKYVSRKDFEYVEMDTDSAYMALSGPLEDIIKPELRRQFFEEYGQWFPRPYCSEHAVEFVNAKMSPHPGQRIWNKRSCCERVYKYHLRTPGLFKVEWSGDGILALNPKTYICWNDDDSREDTGKCSSKGLSKRTNKLTRRCFTDVLATKKPKCGTNHGFIKKDGQMFTYSQVKRGLTYFYAKRKVLEDGISTTSIDI